MLFEVLEDSIREKIMMLSSIGTLLDAHIIKNGNLEEKLTYGMNQNI